MNQTMGRQLTPPPHDGNHIIYVTKPRAKHRKRAKEAHMEKVRKTNEDHKTNRKTRQQNAQMTGIALQNWALEAERNNWRFKRHIEEDTKEAISTVSSPTKRVQHINITINGASPNKHRIQSAIINSVNSTNTESTYYAESPIIHQTHTSIASSPTRSRQHWVQPEGAGDTYVWPLKWPARDCARETLKQWNLGDKEGPMLHNRPVPLKNIAQYCSKGADRERHFVDPLLVKLVKEDWERWGKKRLSDLVVLVNIRERFTSDDEMMRSFCKVKKGKVTEMTTSMIRVEDAKARKAIVEQNLN